VCAPEAHRAIYTLKYVGTFDTENYQIAFPQVTSRLNSGGKTGVVDKPTVLHLDE